MGYYPVDEDRVLNKFNFSKKSTIDVPSTKGASADVLSASSPDVRSSSSPIVRRPRSNSSSSLQTAVSAGRVRSGSYSSESFTTNHPSNNSNSSSNNNNDSNNNNNITATITTTTTTATTTISTSNPPDGWWIKPNTQNKNNTQTQNKNNNVIYRKNNNIYRINRVSTPTTQVGRVSNSGVYFRGKPKTKFQPQPTSFVPPAPKPKIPPLMHTKQIPPLNYPLQTSTQQQSTQQQQQEEIKDEETKIEVETIEENEKLNEFQGEENEGENFEDGNFEAGNFDENTNLVISGEYLGVVEEEGGEEISSVKAELLKEIVDVEISSEKVIYNETTHGGETILLAEEVTTLTLQDKSNPIKTPKFCTECGTPVFLNHKFCGECGTKYV